MFAAAIIVFRETLEAALLVGIVAASTRGLRMRNRWRREFEYGLQGFGDLGKWDHWESEQAHKAGPAVFGKIGLGGRDAIRYNAAYLLGTSAAAPDRTFRFQVEYEF